MCVRGWFFCRCIDWTQQLLGACWLCSAACVGSLSNPAVITTSPAAIIASSLRLLYPRWQRGHSRRKIPPRFSLQSTHKPLPSTLVNSCHGISDRFNYQSSSQATLTYIERCAGSRILPSLKYMLWVYSIFRTL